VKLTTHLQLVPRSRKCGSIHPLHIRLHGVVLNSLNTGTTLPYLLPLIYLLKCLMMMLIIILVKIIMSIKLELIRTYQTLSSFSKEFTGC
jgi:hypothetical protein